MLLRTRITLMVSLVAVLLIGGLLAESGWRTRSTEDEMQRARLQGLKSTWMALEQDALQPLAELARRATQDGALTAAMMAGDGKAVAARVAQLQAESGAEAAAAAIEVTTADGRRLFGSGPQVLTPAILAAARHKGASLAGLLVTADGGASLAVVAPLYSRAGLAGAAAFSVDPQAAVKAVASVVGADIFLTGGGLAAPIASAPQPAPAALTAATTPAGDGSAVLLAEGRRLQLTSAAIAQAVEAPALRLASLTDVTQSERRKQWLSRLSLGGVASATALFLGFLHWYMRRSFTPLNRVIQMLNALAHGRMDTPAVEARGSDEIGRLAATAAAFRSGVEARDQLLKLRQDINAAHAIQASILPPPFPDRGNLQVRGFMQPARDVGGDFYDHFELPDGRLGIVIADVSGKGMAAALFMAVACTVIRSTAQLVADPGECLARANDLLAANNAESMFVTVFYGILCPRSGRLSYANGGHSPPFRIARDGTVSALPRPKGKLLALFEGRPYETAQVMLDDGDLLLLFTDGVTEAQDAEGALLGDGRLVATLTEGFTSAEQLLDRVLTQVTAFAGSAPQADDITCLAVRWVVMAEQPAPLPA